MKLFKYILLLLLFHSCKEELIELSPEPTEAAPVNCVSEYGEQSPSTGQYFEDFDCPTDVQIEYVGEYAIGGSCFNPSNPNEIAFTKTRYEDLTECSYEVWLYDICSEEMSYVTDGVCYGLDWSSKGWFIFSKLDGQLYKIKSNGDSLQQLTNNSNHNNYAKWNDEGDKYIYAETTQLDFYIANENGEIIDDWPANLGGTTWDWVGDFIYVASEEIRKINVETKEVETILVDIDLINNNYYGDLQVSADGENIIWKKGSAIGFTNIISENTILYRPLANHYLYADFDISPNSTDITYRRIDLEYINSCTVSFESNLYFSSLDDIEEERRIDILE